MTSPTAPAHAARAAERVDRSEVHVRVLVADDADWVLATDEAAATALAPQQGWNLEELREDLDEGRWASDDRWGWGIIIAGEPSGFALVTDLASGSARIMIRIAPHARGRGAGREVLRLLADHHFGADAKLLRLTGRAHEHNIPMQRVFNAAGFKMEARYRDSFPQNDGGFASEWGYALTRTDWTNGAHRKGTPGPDLHGLSFVVDETVEGPSIEGLRVDFEQDGRRVTGRYQARILADGELAGLLINDLLHYRFIHVEEHSGDIEHSSGSGRARLQRREDGRVELVDQWSAESGTHGRRVLIQAVDDTVPGAMPA
ncbi:MAG: GNAT family protein [Nitriliruptoraceae bacterium]